MPRGGYHPSAERWGRKPAWKNASDTKTIRVPEELAEQILNYAHKLDEGDVIDYDTKTKSEVKQLRQENDRLRQELAACQQASQIFQPDLEELRDRYLTSLRLGKQAPEYKRTSKVLEKFIDFIQSL
jgi:predicted RNase H-like nuclease (RuvC/YqgF family)